MLRPYIQVVILLFGLITNSVTMDWKSEDFQLATIEISESNGLNRELEYVVCSLQIPFESIASSELQIIAIDNKDFEKIPCQVFNRRNFREQNTLLFQTIFPVSMDAHEKKRYLLIRTTKSNSIPTDLSCQGEGLELIIENEFYRADLSKDISIEPQSYNSGQIREMLIKMGFNQLLTNAEDRLHWAPNFKKPDLEWYTTIAHWESPTVYDLQKGPYRIQTIRQDSAPDHPEIALTAVYQFYEDLPYIKFYSEMKMIKDVWLELLRNDEMTMDSMFTHLAFQRPTGEIVDVAFSERYELLQVDPIENNSPWICFYNIEKGFAFGSIRIRYENLNQYGQPSPTYQAHTQIGEWLGGIKYWNRRLIHDHLTFVPEGSRYIEENAYLVFRIGKNDRFKIIKYWAKRLRHPLEVKVKH